MLLEALPLLMFLMLVPLLFSGIPVAFALGGTGLIFWLLAVSLGLENSNSFYLVISRIFGGVIAKPLLVAIPLFILMGNLLERAGIAEDLLKTLQQWTRRVPGGLALSVALIGVILAATTGIIGASVVMLTVLAMPQMINAGYDKGLAAGTVAASGTLGILLPPSIMLVVMADLLAISAGVLFQAAIVPALMLSGLYMIYLLVRTSLNPALAPRPSMDEESPISFTSGLAALIPPVLLILLVLGSIFGGYATPTEASGLGAAGALLLALVRGKLTKDTLKAALDNTVLTSAMIFGLFIGATAFSFVFTLLGGHDLILEAIAEGGHGPWTVVLTLMATAFILGFFFDWIEITLILLPVFAPVIAGLDFGDHVAPGLGVAWFAILLAVNLQTSFLTPPFGFALFYLKGAAPEGVTIQDVYRGVIPFILLQLAALGMIMLWPEIVTALPVWLSA